MSDIHNYSKFDPRQAINSGWVKIPYAVCATKTAYADAQSAKIKKDDYFETRDVYIPPKAVKYVARKNTSSTAIIHLTKAHPMSKYYFGITRFPDFEEFFNVNKYTYDELRVILTELSPDCDYKVVDRCKSYDDGEKKSTAKAFHYTVFIAFIEGLINGTLNPFILQRIIKGGTLVDGNVEALKTYLAMLKVRFADLD